MTAVIWTENHAARKSATPRLGGDDMSLIPKVGYVLCGNRAWAKLGVLVDRKDCAPSPDRRDACDVAHLLLATKPGEFQNWQSGG
jgi:hypothetical protein